jgi:argininosuccinate lyase
VVRSGESAAIVSSNSTWGGRFAEGPSAIMRAINASIGFDRALWRQDIRGSLAHAAMLAHVGIISRRTRRRSARARRHRRPHRGRGLPLGRGPRRRPHEHRGAADESIGEAGKRLHTARSRNDQVALDLRLWVRDAIDGLSEQVRDAMRALASARRSTPGR